MLGFTNPGGELYDGRAEPKPPISYGTFCGVQVLHRSIFDAMAGEAFSIIDTYDALIGAGERVHFFDAGDLYWSDLGTPDDLENACRVHRASLAADELLGGPPISLRSGYSEAPATRRSSGSYADAGRSSHAPRRPAQSSTSSPEGPIFLTTTAFPCRPC